MSTSRRFRWCIVVLFSAAVFIYLIPAQVQAQYYTGPISSALGGTGRAASEPEEGVFLNPAVLPHAKEFSTALFYDDGQVGDGLGETTLGVSFVDNTEGIFIPGSVSYLRRRRTFPGMPSVNEEYWQVSVGKFVTQYLSLGLSIHNRSIDQEGAEDFTYWNGSLGGLWAPSPQWGLGLVWENFSAKQKDSIPGYLEDLPEVGLGFVYLFENILKARLDASQLLEENPDKKWKLGLGVETYLNNFMALRLGAELDEVSDRQFVTAGLAFLGPRLKIDYAFRKNTKDGKGAMHSVDFRVPF